MSSINYCVKERKGCVGWIERYFKDCLCNVKDEFSFGFGLSSLVCWGVAEIPQIITNFRTKSSHGVSLLFLLTWVAGDIFNLTGCLLEPATVSVRLRILCLSTAGDVSLPTQFYTALLYTISTVVLVLQGVYYDHIFKRLKGRHTKATRREEDEKKPLAPKSGDAAIPIPKASVKSSPRREYYYTSARSLASSGTPPFRTFLRAAQSGPSALGLDNDSSSDDEAASAAPTLSSSGNPPTSQPRAIPRSAGYGTFLAASVNLPFQSNALAGAMAAGFHSRTLLNGNNMEHSAFGQWLGWLMAAIYMGGRLPQIWLNGLNPLMFVFALVANVTYVLRYFRKKSADYGEDDDGDYVDATKAND
ncbi:hypothetical protein WN943_021348 [Citrus x changshan-huyou]